MTSTLRNTTLCAAAVAILAAAAPAPAADRPNIIVILSDDMGYSDIGAFGGEIQTPNIDKLAQGGRVFSQFYNTARCCPSRAALLTGLYPHQAGVGHLINDTGHIGYGDFLTSDSITLAEVLKSAGYGTYMSGKWHLAPRSYDEKKDAKHWPNARGFDHFYGTIAGSGSFYDPGTLCRDGKYISPLADPEYKPENYYYTDALTDNAIRYVNDHLDTQEDKPFFLYLAYTAAHWPLQAPEDAIAPYKGKYAAGYEAIHQARAEKTKALGLLPNLGDFAPAIADWDARTDKPVQERLMETYAAMVTRMDDGIGRLLSDLRTRGQLDNTLIIYLQDNGGCEEDPWPERTQYDASVTTIPADQPQRRVRTPMYTREGKQAQTGHDLMAGPADVFVAYLEPWANVSNSPFRKYKHFVHEGGISTPMIAHWPAAIKPGADHHIIRTPAHLIDLMPTLLQAAGASYPAQRKGTPVQPMEGISLLPALTADAQLSRTQPLFWEHESNRAVRDGQWKLVATGDTGPWELYDMNVDRGEMHDLAAQHPDRVKQMAAQWDAWAARSRVLPLGGWRDKRGAAKSAAAASGDGPQSHAATLVQGQPVSVAQSLNLLDSGVSITATLASGPVEGVIVAQGASLAGFSLYAEDGKLHLVRNGWADESLEDTLPATITTPCTVHVAAYPGGRVRWKITGDKPRDFVTSKPAGGKGFRKNPTQPLAAGIDTETPVGSYPKNFKYQGTLGPVLVETISQKKERPIP